MPKDRRNTKRDLNNSQKIAAVNDMINNPNNKLNKEHLETLLDKYGPYAYDVIKQCQLEPKNILDRVGKPFMVSRKAIEYFASTDLPAEDIAKAIKKDAQTVAADIQTYHNDNATENPIQQQAHEQQQKMEARIDEHNDSKTNSLTPSDKQLKAIKSWAKSIHLNPDETAAKLVEKYGALAYDVMDNCMNKPSVVMRNMGKQPLGSSPLTLEYFLNNDLSTEDLAKALKKDKAYIEQKIPTQRQQHFDNKVDNKVKEKEKEKEKVKEVAEEKETPSKPKQPQKPEEKQEEPQTDTVAPVHSGNMTLDDYVHCYKPKDKPLSGKALEDAAYQDFGAGEGVVNGIYTEWENKGNPTLGIGGLVIPKELCAEPLRKTKQKGEYKSPYDQVYGKDGWLERFKKIPLTDKNGKALSAAQKETIFEDIRRAVRTNTLKTTKTMPHKIIYPTTAANVRISSTAIKNKFNQDFHTALTKAQSALGKGDIKKGQEIFNKYPKDLQLALVHTYYVGKPGNSFTTAVMQGKVNIYDPEDVQKKISALRPQKNGKNARYCASNAERKTIENAGDSIKTARREYYERQARYAQAKTNQGTVRS